MSLSVPRNRVEKRAKWERLKPVLDRLYMKEDMQLKDIIELMEHDHKFHAT